MSLRYKFCLFPDRVVFHFHQIQRSICFSRGASKRHISMRESLIHQTDVTNIFGRIVRHNKKLNRKSNKLVVRYWAHNLLGVTYSSLSNRNNIDRHSIKTFLYHTFIVRYHLKSALGMRER